MRGLAAHRIGHYLLLLAVGSALVFPYLGAPSLWDFDEGVNAECAREMAETGTWIVPLFNWELRTSKPVFLYWAMRGSYSCFGVTEFAARLPSAIAFLGILLVTYEIGRRMFDAATGLLAGIIAASTLELLKLGHAGTPDAILILFLMLYCWGFWWGHQSGGRGWYLPCGIASGLAMLVKGPVGLVFPATIVGAYFLWHGEFRRMFDRRMIGGIAVWILVAIPWYALVTAETRGEWTKAFFLKDNLRRSTEPMENHRGPVVYYLGMIAIFLAPWSSFLAVALAKSWVRGRVPGPEARAIRFLLIWVVVFLGVFSIFATKLPHYIAPLYPMLALLIANTLVRWARGEFALPVWAKVNAVVGFALTGAVVSGAMLIAGGTVDTGAVRIFPGLGDWAWIGLFPLVGIGAFLRYAKRGRRDRAIAALAVSAVLFAGTLAAYPPLIVDRSKAVKVLVAESGARDLHREARVASYGYPHPSATFYVGRRVEYLQSPEEAARFLAMPHPSYLFVTVPTWERWVAPLVNPPYRIAARRYDFFRNCEALVVTNDR